MLKSSRLSTLLAGGLGIVLAASWLLSEIRWAHVNDPAGQFADLREYLVCGRPSIRLAKVDRGGERFFIAYGPTDFWLALRSGPAAYVFDEDGKLIEWSQDSGDDAVFQQNWPFSAQELLSRDEFKRLAGGERLEPAQESQVKMSAK